MIAYVRGTVMALAPTTAVLDVGGVGLELQCAPGTLADLRLGQPSTLAAALVVREDDMTLYGFADEDERTVFQLLQTVSGVGPRLAQSLLAVHRPDDLRRAVATEDVAALMKVSGVGRKGAQRLVLELKDRLGAPSSGAVDLTDGPGSSPAGAAWQASVHSALVGLGWTTRDADTAVVAVAEELGPDADVSGALRAALRTLDRA